MATEWLLIPAVGTFLVATFVPRAAVRRGFQAAPLALLAMVVALVGVTAMGLVAAPGRMIDELLRFDVLAVAILGGIGGGLGICCVYTALRQRATGPVITVSSMSILIPIGVAVTLGWDPVPAWWNLVGVALTVAGTAMIHLGKSERPEGERYHWLPLALGAVACSGVSQTAQKYIGVLHPMPAGTARYGFMVAYYVGAVIVVAGFLAWTRQPVQWRVWPFALPQGLNSSSQFLCMLALLQGMNTSVVYITFTGGGIVLVMLISALLLRERYRAPVWIGCVLGVAGIVLVRWK